MPMYKGIERWGTLDYIPHGFHTGSPPWTSEEGLIPVKVDTSNGECLGDMWGTSKRVPHAETPVNKGIGGM